MPLTHTATFAVRHYELDGYGHVNNTVYLRYLQEAAIQASTAAGYGPERYVALNRAWHVHDTEIEYLRALKYGDTVNVRTWVADFSSVRSRRMYELFRAGNDELVARAYSDWVFLDTTTGRPAPILPELRLAFFPDGEARAVLKRDRFPEPPPPPPGAFVMRRRAEWRDMDVEGHVNNATYLAYIGECAYQAAAALGWPAERTWAEGFGILARRHRIQYLQPAVYDDELEISTYLFDVGGASATRHFRLARVNDGALIARVNSLYVWVDRATLRPTRMPAHIRADIAPNIAVTK
ncbi:MAG: thioesterase family protein [Anaerolineales bacterium]